MPEFLDSPIEYLSGVGPQRAELLKKELQIFTFQNLIYHFPFRYIDRTKFYKISDIQDELTYVQIKGKILKKEINGTGRKQRLTAIFSDGENTIELVWFQGIKWVQNSVKEGLEYIIFGKPTLFKNKYNIPHPEMEIFNGQVSSKQKFQPVYHTTEKLKKNHIDYKFFGKLMEKLFAESENKIHENLSQEIIENYKLIPHPDALKKIHFPENNDDISKATLRLRFEEIFFIQLKLFRHKLGGKKSHNAHVLKDLKLFNEFYHNYLPFQLTNAQQRVIKEIYKDLCSGKQMNRLLQGDVGSGKTIVAFLCCLIAIGNEGQATIMAPTEILAEQHYKNLKPLAEKLNLNIELLTGSTKTSQRKNILQNLLEGSLNIIIGTHALIEEDVKFKNLSLTIIDEQHRFGVAQRAKLWKRNAQNIYPHVLVMTATPIPRTLAMTFYGDLDTSVIDELPTGRKPIITVHRFDSKRIAVFQFLKEQIAQGKQVYVVYPLIEESEKMDLKNLEDGHESIKRAFPQCEVGILHGKMKSENKDFEMQRFKKKETQIMVSTTVIEVGIDIPNATVMLIENAERFGLSQLHQLRGRVGRGAEQSYCILMTDYKLSKDTKVRIETMCRTNNGFEIAETDLKLRGPGDLMGTQQSGILDLKLTDLSKDAKLIEECRYAAQKTLENDFNLEKQENYPILSYLRKEDKGKFNWGRIS